MFEKNKSTRELLRENQRKVGRSIRELDREMGKVQVQEKRFVSQVRRMAREGDMVGVKAVARDLVRTRQTVAQYRGLKSHLDTASTRMQTLNSTQAMSEAVQGMTRAMTNMNKTMQLPVVTKMMQEFMRAQTISEAAVDVMGDGMEDMMCAEGEADDTETLVSQVLDELGCSVEMNLVDAPLGKGFGATSAGAPNGGLEGGLITKT